MWIRGELYGKAATIIPIIITVYCTQQEEDVITTIVLNRRRPHCGDGEMEKGPHPKMQPLPAVLFCPVRRSRD
jgi:hypothetical protein